jgi:hypothetical protein
LIKADIAAIVGDEANGIGPHGHLPGNELGYAREILGSGSSHGIVLEQNRAGDIAEAGCATEP